MTFSTHLSTLKADPLGTNPEIQLSVKCPGTGTTIINIGEVRWQDMALRGWGGTLETQGPQLSVAGLG